MCTLQVLHVIVLCLYPSAFSFIFFSFRSSDHLFDRSIIALSVGMFFVWRVGLFSYSSLPLLTFCSISSFFLFTFPYRSFLGVTVRLTVRPSFVRFFVRSIVRWSGRSSVLPFDCAFVQSFVRSFVRWSDHLFARSIIPLSVGIFFVWLVGLFFCSSLPFTHLFFVFVLFLFFSLSFFPWCDRSSVHLIVPLYVFSCDRSFVGPVVRLSSRSIVPSFDCSYDHSFVGLIICSPVRSYLCLSVYFCLARWFIFLFVPPFYSPVLRIRSFSFLLLIVLSLCDRSSVRLIVPLFVFPSDRSFVGPIVRLSSRSIVPSFNRSYDHSFVGTIICPPVRSHLRLSVCFFVWLVGLFSCSSFPLLTFCSFTSSFFFLIVLSLV